MLEFILDMLFGALTMLVGIWIGKRAFGPKLWELDWMIAIPNTYTPAQDVLKNLQYRFRCDVASYGTLYTKLEELEERELINTHETVDDFGGGVMLVRRSIIGEEWLDKHTGKDLINENDT